MVNQAVCSCGQDNVLAEELSQTSKYPTFISGLLFIHVLHVCHRPTFPKFTNRAINAFACIMHRLKHEINLAQSVCHSVCLLNVSNLAVYGLMDHSHCIKSLGVGHMVVQLGLVGISRVWWLWNQEKRFLVVSGVPAIVQEVISFRKRAL